MVTAVLTKTVIFDEVMYKPGGLVHKWMGLVTTKFEMHAKHYAPVRTGNLRAGISSGVTQIGPEQVVGTIESTAEYSLYVLRGTTGPIMRTKAFRAGGDKSKAYVKVWMGRTKAGGWSRRSRVDRQQRSIRRKGWFLRLEPWGEFPVVFAFSVAGQDANNFLLRAWRATARNHKAIRGKEPSFILNP